MKKRMKDLLTNKKAITGIAAVALAFVIGGVSFLNRGTEIMELPEFTDPVMEVSLEQDDPALGKTATPKTTTKTTSKTTKKNVKLKKASTKTYTKKLPVTKKTSTKTVKSSTQTVKTQTTVKTAVTEKYTKKSKVKVVTTKVTTTVKTTTTPIEKQTSTPVTTAQKGKYEVSVTALAPRMDARVLNAYQTMGFKVYVDSSVSYAGYFNARDRSIIMREESDNLYHELGHFLAFISGNTDQSSAFKATYQKEKGKYTGYNKAYVTQDSSEYFAESTRDYILNASALKSARPETYAAVETALSKVTDAQIAKLMKMYSVIWK